MVKKFKIEIYGLSDISAKNQKFFKPNKYGNIAYFYNDIGFMSLEEAKRYKEFKEN